MRGNDPQEGFRYVLETFEQLAQKLDDLHADNAADGNDPEITARLQNAKTIALRGSEIVREHIGHHPGDRIQMTG